MRIHALLLLAACTADPSAFVAYDGEVAIAVLRNADGGTLAYSCGATPDTVGTHTTWFNDTDASGGWTLEVVEHPDGLELTLDGVDTRTLVATPAVDPLYEHDGYCRDGAILTEDVAVGRWCDVEQLSYQVEPLEWMPGDPDVRLQVIGDSEIFRARLSVH